MLALGDTELLLAAACLRLRSLRVELPTQGELERVVTAAATGFTWTFTARSPTARHPTPAPESTNC